MATRADLLEIIDDRAAPRATVITHQLIIEHWHAWLGDPTVADAILDRLMHHGQLLKFEGKSWRWKEAAARVAKRTSAA